jgi:hypothetical protein
MWQKQKQRLGFNKKQRIRDSLFYQRSISNFTSSLPLAAVPFAAALSVRHSCRVIADSSRFRFTVFLFRNFIVVL